MRQLSGLRYGENPHQPAAFYSDLSLAEHGKGGIATAVLHHGKEVSSSISLHQQLKAWGAMPSRQSLCICTPSQDSFLLVAQHQYMPSCRGSQALSFWSSLPHGQ